MIGEIIQNEWVQFLALVLTLIGGLSTFRTVWEPPLMKAVRPFKTWFTLNPRPSSNPFSYRSRITNPALFFGREPLLQKIFVELEKGTNLSLLGRAQIGKSSILHHICHLGPQKLPEKKFIYLDLQYIYDEGDFFIALCDKLGLPEYRGYKLHRALKNQQVILCLDEIERMTSQQFSGNERIELRGLAEGQNAPLTLLIASRSPLETLFPDSPLETSPLAGICQTIEVPPFTFKEVYQFLQTRLQPTDLPFEQFDLETLWRETQGHPAAVQKFAAQWYRQRVKNRLKTVYKS